MMQELLDFIDINKPILGGLAGGLVVVVGALWAVYTHFYPRQANSTSPTRVGGISTDGGDFNAGRDVYVVSGNLTIGSTTDDMARYFKKLEADFTADEHVTALKEAELRAVREKLANLQDVYDAQTRRFDKTVETLSKLATKQEILEVREGLNRNDGTALADALRAQVDAGGEGAAEALLRLGEFAEARVDFEAALAAYTRAAALAPDSDEARKQAGRMASTIGRYDVAEQQFKALVVLARRPGSEALAAAGVDIDVMRSFRLSNALEELGEVYSFTKQREAARDVLSEALSLVESDEERENPSAPATSRVEDLRAKLASLGLGDDDLLSLRRALRNAETDTLHWVDKANELAEKLAEKGRDEEAKPLYERALAIADKRAGPDNQHNAYVRVNYSFLLARAGEFDEAERLQAEAFDLFGTNHPIPVTVLKSYADFCNEAGETDRAIAAFQRAIDRAQSRHQVGDMALPILWIALGKTADSAGKRDIAAKAYDQAIVFLETEQPDDADTAESLSNLRTWRSNL